MRFIGQDETDLGQVGQDFLHAGQKGSAAPGGRRLYRGQIGRPLAADDRSSGRKRLSDEGCAPRSSARSRRRQGAVRIEYTVAGIPRKSSSLAHAREKIAAWAEDYNTGPPHSSLGYATPAAFAADLEKQGAASPAHVDNNNAEALIATG